MLELDERLKLEVRVKVKLGDTGSSSTYPAAYHDELVVRKKLPDPTRKWKRVAALVDYADSSEDRFQFLEVHELHVGIVASIPRFLR
jgi:hypothetical protein